MDSVFVDSLTRDKHIVVFGSSKQGKTSLRKWNIDESEYISVMCGHNFTSLAPLHSAILKEAGYIVEQSSTRTVSGDSKISAKFSADINLGGGKVGAGLGADKGNMNATAVTEGPLELDPTDVNDIIRALQEIGFSKYIVLEDFHYLPTDTQGAFALALKAFHEQSNFTFIVVGVWLDENRLLQFNGDLTGRVLGVDADTWTKAELRQVVELGQDFLNVVIDSETVDRIIEGSYESVSIVQEACYRICERADIHHTQETPVVIGAGVDVAGLVKSIVDDQSARYYGFIANFATGFQETQLEMYKWLMLPVLMASAEDLEAGLGWTKLRRTVDASHPSAPINPGNLTQALRSVASLQVKAKTIPIILDYDETRRRLDVVDRGFLIWLSYQDRAELRASIDLPEQPNMPPENEAPKLPF